ncbi:hypothetical protein AB5I41_28875 [Sphingomonas sp. MMS24-JH45]
MVRTMTGSRIVLDIKMPEAAFFINADRSQFDTAIINMGINARDAMNGEGHFDDRDGTCIRIPALRGHAALIGDLWPSRSPTRAAASPPMWLSAFSSCFSRRRASAKALAWALVRLLVLPAVGRRYQGR